MEALVEGDRIVIIWPLVKDVNQKEQWYVGTWVEVYYGLYIGPKMEK